jgi:hypothetical protein
MRWHTRRMVPVGLGVGLVLTGVAAAALWIHRLPGTFRALPAPVVSRAEEPAPHLTPQDLEALTAEVERLKEQAGEPAPRFTSEDVEALKTEVKRLQAGQEAWERRSAAMSRELSALRTQLPRVGQDPAPIGRERHQRAKAGPAGDYAAEAPPLTPDEASAEDEHARAEAQTQAQIEAFEGTLVEEDADPGWANAAQRALQEVFHREAMAGLRLVQVDCRTSLCRLELALDWASSPGESLEQLIHFAPWEGAGFAQIDEASGTAVVYLSREGYALPQTRD